MRVYRLWKVNYDWACKKAAAELFERASKRPSIPQAGTILTSQLAGFSPTDWLILSGAVRDSALGSQRRRRLAHPERPLCPISVQRRADYEIVFSAAQRSDAAGTRLTRPRTAICAERVKSTQSVLSKKDRTALRFLGFTSYCRRGADAPVFIVVDAKR